MIFQAARLLVLFCPKVLSTSIGVFFKLWVFTSQSFMFYLVLGFYPLVLEFLSSCEFSSNFGFLFYLDVRFYPKVLEFLSVLSFHQPQLHVLFSPRVLSESIGVSFKLCVFNLLRLLVLFFPKVLSTSIGVYFKLWIFTSHSFMFYLVLGFYPLVLEFLSSCEFVN